MPVAAIKGLHNSPIILDHPLPFSSWLKSSWAPSPSSGTSNTFDSSPSAACSSKLAYSETNIVSGPSRKYSYRLFRSQTCYLSCIAEAANQTTAICSARFGRLKLDQPEMVASRPWPFVSDRSVDCIDNSRSHSAYSLAVRNDDDLAEQAPNFCIVALHIATFLNQFISI